MSFAKVDEGILMSSLWADDDALKVFIAALVTARPFDTTEPIPELDVRTMQPTGWLIPPGWYGLIRASGPGLVSLARKDRDAGMAALERLAQPDVDSRTPDFDGRRLVRIAGGYLVLNFQKYRDRDHGTAKRSKLYRERKKKARSVTRDDTVRHAASRVTGVASRDKTVTVTEAEAEAEADKDQTPAATSAAGGVGAEKKKGAKSRKPYDKFLEAYALMPKREGGHNRAAAWRAYEALTAAGETHDALKAGVVRYAAFIRAKGKEGSQYVKAAANFFADREYEKDWAPAPQSGTRPEKLEQAKKVWASLKRHAPHYAVNYADAEARKAAVMADIGIGDKERFADFYNSLDTHALKNVQVGRDRDALQIILDAWPEAVD